MKISWTAKLIVTLVAISGVCYGINYLIFKDIPYMLRLITLQVGFVPVSVVLISKRSFLLLVLENPNLLEREEFTDLLSAIAHLTEELERRTDLTRLGQADYQHIAVDIKRAYALLLPVWLDYSTSKTITLIFIHWRSGLTRSTRKLVPR
ncbi:MAG: hypothetical protein PHQ43_03675 [Dehalococcoidales bacterium]|nr:hypothetical protein [Dehalococcoidales bacterium]